MSFPIQVNNLSLVVFSFGYVLVIPLFHSSHSFYNKKGNMNTCSQLQNACNEGDVEKVKEILSTKQSNKKNRSSLILSLDPPDHEEILSLIFTFIEEHKMEAELLYSAATYGTKKLIKMGVEKRGWDIHSEHQSKQPIQRAAECGRENEVRYFLERGANPNARTIQIINQPLHLSCSHKGNIKVVKLLVETGAGVEEKGREEKGEKDNTPIKYAVKCGDEEVVEYLIERGAKVDAMCLTHATKKGNFNMVQLLLKYKPPQEATLRSIFNHACEHPPEVSFLFLSFFSL